MQGTNNNKQTRKKDFLLQGEQTLTENYNG